MLRVLSPTFKPVINLICCKTRFDVGGKTRKHRYSTSLRSRRLEVVGERENGRARVRHARGECLLRSRARFFLCPLVQTPATQATIQLVLQKCCKASCTLLLPFFPYLNMLISPPISSNSLIFGKVLFSLLSQPRPHLPFFLGKSPETRSLSRSLACEQALPRPVHTRALKCT